MTKEETGLKRSAFLYNSCTTKHSGNISSIAKKNVFLCMYVCVAYVVVGQKPHICCVDTQILSSMHGQR